MPLHILWQIVNDHPQDVFPRVYQSFAVNETGIYLFNLRLRKNYPENCLIFTTVMRAIGECLSAHLQCIR